MISQTPSQSKVSEDVTHDTPPETDDLPVTNSNQSYSTNDQLSVEDISAASDVETKTPDQEKGITEGESTETDATQDEPSQTDESDEDYGTFEW
ncbi:hypothetical protein JIR001_07950 [Polycladomyces abyssicola]|uniref:Uncharacterized protein n=2 Tax=Polycladomyces abyssicola TaxID=1125966 RepID=A0A8D5UD23_9BACL|nr:hypothetical protein JIR001_07950 [Polycladomyces abyssicola]